MFGSVIEEALANAKCVIVVWSEASVRSHWVMDEANEVSRNLLVPVLIDDVRPPLGFRSMQAARLTDWPGREPHAEFDKVVQAVTALVGVSSPARLPEPSSTSHETSFTNDLGISFVHIPAGTFHMGSSADEVEDVVRRYNWKREWVERELPKHQVTISQSFDLGKYPVTQSQWEAVMDNNPSDFPGDSNRPVENVSWDEAQAFIAKLNEREGGDARYRLPTEAEWEYAARAGSTTAYSFGDDPGRLGEYAWYDANFEGETHAVGQLKPNAWGLYDMHGNVWEWVQDWYGDYSAESITDPTGPPSGTARVMRGGSWGNDAGDCRSAFRHYWRPWSTQK